MASKPKPAKPLAYEAGGAYFSPEEAVCHYLQFIPADHENWFFVLCGIAKELGNPGRSIAEEWSKQWDRFKQSEFESSWKSALRDQYGRDMGVLRRLALDNGYQDDRKTKPAPRPPPDPKKIEAEKRAELKKKREEASAAGNGRAVYQLAKPCQAHGYLKDKGVTPVKGLRAIDAAEAIRPGVSFGPNISKDSGRLLVVPIVNESGEIQSLEAITPGGVKGYLAGAKKREGFFVIGEKADTGMVYVVEGLATGLSVYQATTARAHVAFDAGQLKAVVEITRRRFPEARIIIAGDLDESETGQKKARAAAAAVNGRAIFPDFTAVEGRTWGDWNDLHQAAGLEVVTAQITAAMAEPAADPAPEPAPSEPPPPQSSIRKHNPYSVNDSGTWHTDADGEKTFICTWLRIVARTRNERGEAWGVLLEFKDPEDRVHRLAIPIKLLAGDGVTFRETLMEHGLTISPNKPARAHLSIYVQTAEPGKFVHCAEQTGWIEIDGERVFVLPDTTIGPDTATSVLYQGPTMRGYGVRGTLEEWQNTIGLWCTGNSRLLLAMSMAFAAPLLELCGAEGGGVNLRGPSSTGKTTVLRAAVSVTGGPEALQRMRGTANGIEGIACSHNHGLLVLDEMGQVAATEAGEIIYMLSNGAEKLRGARTGGLREVRRWLLLFLLSAELGLADHMLSVGKRARAGQEVRLLDIPADTGKHGAFEELHGHESGAEFSRAITRAAGQFHGTAFRAFLEKLTAMDDEDLREWVELKRHQFIAANLSGCDPSGQAIRAGHRFAIIAAAGELASQFGIVPWPDGSASWAARVCFDAWLRARGGAGNQEPRDMLEQVRHFLAQHGESRFTPFECERCGGTGEAAFGRFQDGEPAENDKASDKSEANGGDKKSSDKKGKWIDGVGKCHMCNGTGKTLQRTVNAAGYRKIVETALRDPDDGAEIHHRHYLIYPESWKNDLCAGLDAKAVTALMLERGILLPDPRTPHKAQKKVRPPGEAPRWFYVVNFDAEGWEL